MARADVDGTEEPGVLAGVILSVAKFQKLMDPIRITPLSIWNVRPLKAVFG